VAWGRNLGAPAESKHRDTGKLGQRRTVEFAHFAGAKDVNSDPYGEPVG
jgi:hypothetical protein